MIHTVHMRKNHYLCTMKSENRLHLDIARANMPLYSICTIFALKNKARETHPWQHTEYN